MGNISSNFLGSLYTDLHRGMNPSLGGHKSVYFDPPVELSGPLLDELDWWFSSLQHGLSRRSQPSDAKVFSLHFRDGSGTGTGGTGIVIGPKPSTSSCQSELIPALDSSSPQGGALTT
jgi:hypothetical protein